MVAVYYPDNSGRVHGFQNLNDPIIGAIVPGRLLDLNFKMIIGDFPDLLLPHPGANFGVNIHFDFS